MNMVSPQSQFCDDLQVMDIAFHQCVSSDVIQVDNSVIKSIPSVLSVFLHENCSLTKPCYIDCFLRKAFHNVSIYMNFPECVTHLKLMVME